MNTENTLRFAKPTWAFGLFGIVVVFGLMVVLGLAVARVLNPETTLPRPEAVESFGTVAIVGPKTGIAAAEAPDMNVNLRGRVAISGTKDLITSPNSGNLVDPRAPKICAVFTPTRKPEVTGLYAIHTIATDGRTVLSGLERNQPAAVGFKTTPGEAIKMAATGVLNGSTFSNPYNIGGGWEAMVQYADNDSIFLHVANRDVSHEGIEGYSMHIVGINTDPTLLVSYNSLNAGGRNSLPAVKGGQTLGTAKGSEVIVYIRDSGDFLDPRWIADWWTGCPGVGGNPNPTPIPTGSQTGTPTPSPTPSVTPTPTPGGGGGAACVKKCVASTKYSGNYSYCNYCCGNGTCPDFGGGGGNGQTHLECVAATSGGGKVKLNDNAAEIKYDGPWQYVKGGGGTSIMFQTDYHFAPAPLSSSTATKNVGANFSLTFTGDQVGVRLIQGGNRGYADVYIDGVKVDSLNMHTGGAILDTPAWQSDKLACKEHTLKVTQSDADVANHGKVVVLDYLEYSKCGGTTAFACAKVSGAGDNKDGCTAVGSTCAKTSAATAVDKCWGNPDGVGGRCYDCNGDATINILDFSCFRKNWMQTVN